MKHGVLKSVRRILAVQAAVSFLAVTLFGIGFHFYFKRAVIQNTQLRMQDLLESIANQMPGMVTEDWCSKVARDSHFRLTVISSGDGRVTCDTVYDAARMSPLLQRPEVQSALIGGSRFGSSERFSPTLKDQAFYSTLEVKTHGVVLRAGVQLGALHATLAFIDHALIVTAGFLLIWMTAMTYAVLRMTRRI